MNRATRRADAARAKMQRNAERMTEAAERAKSAEAEADRMRMLLFAVARREGRLRISAEDLAALREDDQVEMHQTERGDVVIEFHTTGAG